MYLSKTKQEEIYQATLKNYRDGVNYKITTGMAIELIQVRKDMICILSNYNVKDKNAEQLLIWMQDMIDDLEKNF